MVIDNLQFFGRRTGLGVVNTTLTLPVVRWTWTGLSDDRYHGRLPELRPADRETVHEFMQGRYLLAAKLVDTGGVSPFSHQTDHQDWLTSLHSFAWLRHFKDVRDDGTRRFARTLILDWIGREGRYDRRTWSAGLCAQRVMNWLRHYSLLLDGAGPEQGATIARALNAQVQSLRLRAQFIADPMDSLLAHIALVAAAVCHEEGEAELARRVPRLEKLLAEQLDGDGMHLSRSPRHQMTLLTEIVSLRQALQQNNPEVADRLAPTFEAMHRAFDATVLVSGEAAYFNGGGPLPHDVMIAVQGRSPARWRRTGLCGGYGTLVSGRSALVADGGQVPPPEFGLDATASALALEFSHGTDLLFGSCGPAPAELSRDRDLFRAGIAHSGPTVDEYSAANIAPSGVFAGRLRDRGAPSEISLNPEENSLLLRTHAYEGAFGVTLERRLTLLSDGKTLVGQDRMNKSGDDAPSGLLTVRFHLAPKVQVLHAENGSVVLLRTPNAGTWSFLWEGAELIEEDSVRRSAYLGFTRTRQLVLEAPVADGAEVAWIFTLQER